MPYGQRYVPWYQEMAYTEFSAGGKPKYLQWTLFVRDALTSSTAHKLQITLPQLRNYLPTDTANFNAIQCFWLPVKDEETQLGYPLWTAAPCTLTTNVQPYYYLISPSWETLPAGHYVLRVTFENNATSPARTFDISDSSKNNPAQYSEISFQLTTPTATYNDILRVNTLAPFVSAYMTHNSLTANSYDYMFVNFKVPSNVQGGNTAGTAETILAVDIRSEAFYPSATPPTQDLKVSTDPLMFVNEAAGKFVNGGRYPFKLYVNNTIDVTAAITTSPKSAILTLHYGQWDVGETPISLRLSLADTPLNSSDLYQLRIPMIRNPATSTYPLNIEVYIQQVVQGVSPFPQNISAYKFVNYAVYSINAITPSSTFVNVDDLTSSNRAQSNNIQFSMQFLGL